MEKDRDGDNSPAGQVISLNAWKRAKAFEQGKPLARAVSPKDDDLQERIERIKRSIVRINALIQELKTGGQENAQVKDGSRR